jgi:hypothetical protein
MLAWGLQEFPYISLQYKFMDSYNLYRELLDTRFDRMSCRVVKTTASNSGVPGSNLCPGDRLSSLRFLWFSSVPPGYCRDSTLKLGHDRFLPDIFKFIIIHLSLYHRRYIV